MNAELTSTPSHLYVNRTFGGGGCDGSWRGHGQSGFCEERIYRRALHVFIRLNSRVGAYGRPAAPKMGVFMRMNAGARTEALLVELGPLPFIRMNASTVRVAWREAR